MRPALGGGGAGVVQRFLRGIEIAQQPDQRREHAPPVRAIDRVQRVVRTGVPSVVTPERFPRS